MAWEHDEFRIRHGGGDLCVQARIAATVVLAGEDEAGMADPGEPRRHLGLGVDVENAQEHVFVRIDDLLHAPPDHVRRASRELGREPAFLERFEHRRDALGAHRGDDGADLGAVVRGSKGRRAVQAERQHAVGIAPRVGGADHPAERVSGDVGFLDVQLAAQGFEVLHQIIQRVRRRGRGRGPMAAQVITHASELRLQKPYQAVPTVARRADAMNENQRRAAAFDRVGGLDHIE